MCFELSDLCADNGEDSIKVTWFTVLKSASLLQFCAKTFSGVEVNCSDKILAEGQRIVGMLRNSSRAKKKVSQRERCGITALDGGWKAHKKRRNDAQCMYSDGYVCTLEEDYKSQVCTSPLTRKGKKTHRHPTPKLYKACRDGELEAGMFSSWLLQWAAVATTKLLKTKNPALYNSMEMNATRHRFPAKCGSIWTSVRLAWMRKGTRCPNHRDHHNMPGTVATSVTINLGGVAGGELCLYNDKGEVTAMAEVDDCMLADFRHQHEVLRVTKGNRLSIIFWQQGGVVRYERMIERGAHHFKGKKATNEKNGVEQLIHKLVYVDTVE